MAIVTGAPAALKVGGATSSGPAPGIYHVKVTDVQTGTSSKKGTPFVGLELTVHKDPDHAAKEGKKLTVARFYFPHPDETDADKVKQVKGMLKRNLYLGFGIQWPKEEKALDVRQFSGKEAWVQMDFPSKSEEGEDARCEVRRIAQKREDLEPKDKAGESNEETEAKPATKPSGRR